jgi:hypothetical protein
VDARTLDELRDLTSCSRDRMGDSQSCDCSNPQTLIIDSLALPYKAYGAGLVDLFSVRSGQQSLFGYSNPQN